jgi:hypothetical protein
LLESRDISFPIFLVEREETEGGIEEETEGGSEGA